MKMYLIFIYLTLTSLAYAVSQKDLQDILYKGILNNSKEEIKKAIQLGADVNLPINGNAPLALALILDKNNSLDTLLEYNVIIDNSLIQYAIGKKKFKLAFFFMKKCCININTTFKGYTLLQHSLSERDIETALLLIKAGADYSQKTFIGNWPRSVMECAIIFNNTSREKENGKITLNLIEELIKRGYNVNNAWSLGFGSTGFHGLFNGNLEILKLFLKNGADPNYTIYATEGPYNLPGTTWTPLMRAAYSCDKEAVKLLLKSGADVNKKASPNLKWNGFELLQPNSPFALIKSSKSTTTLYWRNCRNSYTSWCKNIG